MLCLENRALSGPASVSWASHQNPEIGTNSAPGLPTGPLTVEQAFERALDADGRIATLKAAVEVARQQRRAATDIKDPELQAQSRSTGQSSSTSGDYLDSSRISATAFIPNPWLTIPRVDARTAEFRAAQADLSAAIWLVRCDVRRLFAQMNYLTNDLSLCAERVRLNGEVLTAVQARAGQGAATATDLMTASRQYLQFQDDLDQANHRYQLAKRQLASLLDVPPETLRLATNSVELPSLPDSGITFPQAETIAEKTRSDLAALHWRTLAAGSTYHEIRNQRLPWISEVKAGYIDSSEKYWVGAAMDVPIFSWISNHAADAALAKQTLAGVNETDGLRQIRQELHDAIDQMDETRDQQIRNDTTVEPLIATMRKTLAALKSTPNVMPEQVAAAELQLVETLRFDLGTRWQYQLALLNLESVVGAPLDRGINPKPAH